MFPLLVTDLDERWLEMPYHPIKVGFAHLSCIVCKQNLGGLYEHQM